MKQLTEKQLCEAFASTDLKLAVAMKRLDELADQKFAAQGEVDKLGREAAKLEESVVEYMEAAQDHELACEKFSRNKSGGFYTVKDVCDCKACTA